MTQATRLTAIRNHIGDAMETLERLPQGGIGADGPTRDEIDDAAATGHVIGDDGAFEVAQSAWRFLEEALVLIDEGEQP